MELSTDHLNKLEAFLTDHMSEEEKIAFELEISQNQDLKEFIDIYHKIDVIGADEEWSEVTVSDKILKARNQLFTDAETVKFATQLKEYRTEMLQKKTPVRKLWIQLSAGAAAACAAILILFNLNTDPSLAELYNQNSSWNELPTFVVKGADDDAKLAIENAFKAGNFSSSESLAKEILEGDSAQPTVLLYLGISQLEQDKFQESLHTFTLLTESDAIDAHKGYWYSALVYLKMEDKLKAINALKKVTSKSSHYMYKEARDLLELLKE